MIGQAPWNLDRRAWEALAPPGPNEVALMVGVAFWGAAFRRLFVDLALASLLAPGNLLLSAALRPVRLLVATTAEDWSELQREPLLAAARQVAAVEHLPISPGADKYAEMSRAHRLMAERAIAAGADMLYLCPDAILSDGAVPALERVIAAGAATVLVPAMRHAETGILAELAPLRRSGLPLALPARALMDIGLRHLHPDTRLFSWSSPYFAYQPVCVFWEVSGEAPGILLHAHSWGPLIVSYRRIARHDTSALERWTMDGDYVFRNFGMGPDVAAIVDSDVLAYISVTPDADRQFGPVHNPFKHVSVRVMADSAIMDPLKRALFRLPVRFHAGETGPAWEEAERRAGRVLDRALRPASWAERKWVQIAQGGLAGLPHHVRLWLKRRLSGTPTR